MSIPAGHYVEGQQVDGPVAAWTDATMPPPSAGAFLAPGASPDAGHAVATGGPDPAANAGYSYGYGMGGPISGAPMPDGPAMAGHATVGGATAGGPMPMGMMPGGATPGEPMPMGVMRTSYAGAMPDVEARSPVAPMTSPGMPAGPAPAAGPDPAIAAWHSMGLAEDHSDVSLISRVLGLDDLAARRRARKLMRRYGAPDPRVTNVPDSMLRGR